MPARWQTSRSPAAISSVSRSSPGGVWCPWVSGHANRAKGNAWELPKKFEGRVPLFLNRLMGLPVDQQKLVSLFLSFPYERLD